MSQQTIKDPADAKGKPVRFGDRGGLSYASGGQSNPPPLPPPMDGLLAEIGDGTSFIGIFLEKGRYKFKYQKGMKEVVDFIQEGYEDGLSLPDTVLAACRKYHLHFVS